MIVNIDTIKDWYKESVLRIIPNKRIAQAMIDGKMSLMKDDMWKEIKDFIESLNFPLTIFRGLRLTSLECLNKNDLGKYWTIDKNIFLDKTSKFNDCNVILSGIAQKEDIDFVELTQNYIYYSLNNQVYPESEVTLKDNVKPIDVQILSKNEFINKFT